MSTVELPKTLTEMLEISNARATYQNQLHLAKMKFQAACQISFSGGQFKITPTIIGYLHHKATSGGDRAVIEDESNMPILVEDIKDFLDTISSQYHQALNEYWEEVQRLRSSRKPSVLAGDAA